MNQISETTHYPDFDTSKFEILNKLPALSENKNYILPNRCPRPSKKLRNEINLFNGKLLLSLMPILKTERDENEIPIAPSLNDERFKLDKPLPSSLPALVLPEKLESDALIKS
jgi:hypothetical protein